ncbi:MAG: glycosyltransferase family 2 protein [Acidimicrobiia bacterium]|nr:glycosyltransferase family 2 protein [Acidimicrobiia bacterium]
MTSDRVTARGHATPVTVIIPLFNDREGIARCCASLEHQRADFSTIREILVVDGGSTDGSRAAVADCMNRDPRIRLIDNADRFVSQALNLAVGEASTDVFVRVDSHTTVADDYVDTAVETLEATGADVVGGPMRPRGKDAFGKAVAWALQSRWGIGGSRFHRADYEGEADSVYMLVFTRSTIESFGAFDEQQVRNQDDEYTYRVRARGGRVWLTPRLRSTYEPRSDPAGLAKQFFGYGRYKPRVLKRNPSGMRLRHVAPPAAALAWCVLPLGLRDRRLAAPAVAHLLGISGAAASEGRSGWSDRVTALWIMHVAYGAGFLVGLPDLLERTNTPA